MALTKIVFKLLKYGSNDSYFPPVIISFGFSV